MDNNLPVNTVLAGINHANSYIFLSGLIYSATQKGLFENL